MAAVSARIVQSRPNFCSAQSTSALMNALMNVTTIHTHASTVSLYPSGELHVHVMLQVDIAAQRSAKSRLVMRFVDMKPAGILNSQRCIALLS